MSVFGGLLQPATRARVANRDTSPSFPDTQNKGAPMRLSTRIRRLLREHGRKLWWLHSAYALALGAGVVAFAHKGFENARWLAVSLGVAWLLVVLLFRVLGGGEAELRAFDAPEAKTRVRFYVMTYALKNLYQGMLFFLLPFYWKSTTLDAYNAWFVALLALCAVISTLDIVFDRFVMRWRALASVFHGITLFGCLALVIPALFPDTRALWSLLAAAGITVVGFWTLHVTGRAMRKPGYAALFALSVGAGVGAAYYARAAIPPVPMYVSKAAVGPASIENKDLNRDLVEQGRLAMEVTSLRPGAIQELAAVTDVDTPAGHKADTLWHVWRHDGTEVHRTRPTRVHAETDTRTREKLFSRLPKSAIPKSGTGTAGAIGHWSVDVETDDGQLLGRASFTVAE